MHIAHLIIQILYARSGLSSGDAVKLFIMFEPLISQTTVNTTDQNE